MHPFRHVGLTLLIFLAVAIHSNAWAQTAVVGILEGEATLLRQSTRFTLVEGVRLLQADIVETGAASFVQIELADGVRLGVGANTRVMLAPAGRGLGDASLYLLQGWLKVTQQGAKPAAGEFVTPRVALANIAGASVMLSEPTQFALFVESGVARLGERGAAPLDLTAGDFVSARDGDKFARGVRPAPEFLDKMPRPFRDALPARASRFKDNEVPPRPRGEVSYDDVAAWLHAEPAIRLPLLAHWRGRLKDKAFRAGVIANMAQHPEWHPVVFPPPPPKPPEIKQPPIAPAARASSIQRAP